MNFIYIQQKCYGIITPTTPAEINGMCTDGLSECAGVIVRVNSGGWCILCHADAQTDLMRGVLEWIRQIPTAS